MSKNHIFIDYASEKKKSDGSYDSYITENIKLYEGFNIIGDVQFIISAITPNSVTIRISTINNKANILKRISIFGKIIVLKNKTCKLEIGDWLDFSNGETDTTVIFNRIIIKKIEFFA